MGAALYNTDVLWLSCQVWEGICNFTPPKSHRTCERSHPCLKHVIWVAQWNLGQWLNTPLPSLVNQGPIGIVSYYWLWWCFCFPLKQWWYFLSQCLPLFFDLSLYIFCFLCIVDAFSEFISFCYLYSEAAGLGRRRNQIRIWTCSNKGFISTRSSSLAQAFQSVWVRLHVTVAAWV